LCAHGRRAKSGSSGGKWLEVLVPHGEASRWIADSAAIWAITVWLVETEHDLWRGRGSDDVVELSQTSGRNGRACSTVTPKLQEVVSGRFHVYPAESTYHWDTLNAVGVRSSGTVVGVPANVWTE